MRYQIKTVKINLEINDSILEKVNGDKDAHRVLKAYYTQLDADQEHFSILILDQKNQIRGIKTLFTGGETSSQIDLKVIFRTALLMGAVGLILCHNHPSGEVIPSSKDLQATIAIKEGASLLGLKVLDHIIIGNGPHYSFNEKGLL